MLVVIGDLGIVRRRAVGKGFGRFFGACTWRLETTNFVGLGWVVLVVASLLALV